MATTTRTYRSAATSSTLRTRALGVAGAIIAAVAVWAIEASVLGLHLDIRFGTGAAQTIGVGFIVGATLFASLLGWGVLTLLERRTLHARAIWTAMAVVVVLASLTLPLTAGTTTSTKIALVAMHLAVGAVLIPALRSVSPRS
ncbi:MAG TPA: DUF6069 family protein [Candidatus Dormibacteraeota bacterium]